jgi:two-component system, NtrC family, sensor histidine kinase HydH
MGRFAFHRWTLGAKLAATFAAVISLVVLLVSLWVVARSRSALEHELADRGADAARNLSRLSAELVLEEDLWGLYKVVRDVVGADRDGLVAYAALIDPGGKVLAHSDPARHPMGEPLGAEGETIAKAARPGPWSSDRTSEEAVRRFTAPVIVDNQQVATAYIGISPRKLEATISRISTEIVALGVLLQWLGLVLGYVIARRMTRPLTELGRAVDRIASGRLEDPPLVSTKEKDEIGALADRFNLMAHHLRDSRRKTEEAHAQLIRSERLASIGECAGALAHEIRNPLGAVVAAARMLSSHAPQATTYDRGRLAEVIADEARRLNGILSEFLVFARPRAPSRQPHSMNALVREILELLRLDELARGKTLDGRIGPEGGPCEMDRDQVKQVIWNLLRNALEATHEGGRVVVETAQRDQSVVVVISDEGAGIPAERQRHTFEPFHSSKKGGSGLGLAIAHRIVSAHGGTIGLSSRPGEGTRISVTLPLRAPTPGGRTEAA